MDIQVEISAGTWIFLAVACLVLPLPWILAAIAAGAVHELFHIWAVIAAGGDICTLRISEKGAVLNASAMTGRKACICSLAGPLGSFFLVCFYKQIPVVAFCGLVHGIFNLIPVCPLDGGQALYCFLSSEFGSDCAEVWMIQIRRIIFVVLLLGGILLGAYLNCWYLPAIAVLLIPAKALNRKIPCKEAEHRVQ